MEDNRVDPEMEQKIKALEEKVDYRLTQLAESVSDLTASVRELVERDIRKDAADERQKEINDELYKRISETEAKVRDMEMQRAHEAQGRQWLHNHWPVVSVIVLGVVMTVGYFIRGIIK